MAWFWKYQHQASRSSSVSQKKVLRLLLSSSTMNPCSCRQKACLSHLSSSIVLSARAPTMQCRDLLTSTDDTVSGLDKHKCIMQALTSSGCHGLKDSARTAGSVPTYDPPVQSRCAERGLQASLPRQHGLKAHAPGRRFPVASQAGLSGSDYSATKTRC